MSKKKINIVIALISIMCSFFMSVCIVKMNDTIAQSDANYEQAIKDKNASYDASIKDLITNENASNNNNGSPDQVTYTDFLSTYKASLKYHQTAEKAYMYFNDGDADCAAVDCPVVGTINMVDKINGYYIRNSSGKELFYYDMVGTESLPSIATDYYPNQNYTLIYYDEPTYYEINTSKLNTINNTSGKFNSMSSNTYTDNYKNDLSSLFYTINENTIKEEIYFKQAYSATDTITAKITLFTDDDVNNGLSKYSGTDLYDYQIGKLTGLNKAPATSHSVELTLSFTSDARLKSISVKEDMSLYFIISDFKQEISVKNNYTMFFDYTKDKAINVSI